MLLLFVAVTSQSVQVRGMYRHCGFDADPSASTLQMLTNIEMRLEESLVQVRKLPPEVWEAWEKGREKERRHDSRNLKLQATKEVRHLLIAPSI
jgi:hypothetical protein